MLAITAGNNSVKHCFSHFTQVKKLGVVKLYTTVWQSHIWTQIGLYSMQWLMSQRLHPRPFCLKWLHFSVVTSVFIRNGDAVRKTRQYFLFTHSSLYKFIFSTNNKWLLDTVESKWQLLVIMTPEFGEQNIQIFFFK